MMQCNTIQYNTDQADCLNGRPHCTHACAARMHPHMRRNGHTPIQLPIIHTLTLSDCQSSLSGQTEQTSDRKIIKAREDTRNKPNAFPNNARHGAEPKTHSIPSRNTERKHISQPTPSPTRHTPSTTSDTKGAIFSIPGRLSEQQRNREWNGKSLSDPDASHVQTKPNHRRRSSGDPPPWNALPCHQSQSSVLEWHRAPEGQRK